MKTHSFKKLALNTPVVVMLRDVSAAEMGDLLARDMVANASDDELSRLAPALFRLGEMFGDHDHSNLQWRKGRAECHHGAVVQPV